METIDNIIIDRAQGCLVGQLAGDSLGGLVEFSNPESITAIYPEGVREMQDGGTWNLLAGQPTDDSEMALALARTLVSERAFNVSSVMESYRRWLRSNPFDFGNTIVCGLTGSANKDSQANGALMRLSPLGIFCAGMQDVKTIREMVQSDVELTHPNPVCVDIGFLYVRAISHAISHQVSGEALYELIDQWAHDLDLDSTVVQWTEQARVNKPDTYVFQQGWVKIAYQNALYHLLHSSSVEDSLVATIAEGGDTDTNAAICGALLGAVYGRHSMPDSWVSALQSCRPESTDNRVHHPRPEAYWPCDVLQLSEFLLQARR
jgi:ADP-ribosylglycohydrolase